jgi:CcmD family protein
VEDNLGYLFAAFAITWIGIAAYLAYVSQQVRSLRDELEEMGE